MIYSDVIGFIDKPKVFYVKMKYELLSDAFITYKLAIGSNIYYTKKYDIIGETIRFNSIETTTEIIKRITDITVIKGVGYNTIRFSCSKRRHMVSGMANNLYANESFLFIPENYSMVITDPTNNHVRTRHGHILEYKLKQTHILSFPEDIAAVSTGLEEGMSIFNDKLIDSITKRKLIKFISNE